MTELFSLKDKSELFDNARSMHDCSFNVAYENDTLILVFDHLDRYDDPLLEQPLFDSFNKLTIKFYGIDYLDLAMKFGKKEKSFYNTVSPLDNRELIMFKYSVDSFDVMRLDFRVFIKKKLWGGTIEISPTEIEYTWE